MAYDDRSEPGPVDAAPRSVTAFFDSQDAADQARRDLVGAGVPEGDIRVAAGPSTAAEPAHHHGFWDVLTEFFVPEDDRHLYAEGLRRGGAALSVRTDGAAYDRVLEILDRDGAVDMDERSAGWREEGWSAFGGAETLGGREMAYTAPGGGTGGFAASRADQPLFDGPMEAGAIEPGSAVPDPSRVAAAAPDTAYAAAAPGSPSPGDVSLNRDTGHGRARVRSYIGEPSSEPPPRV